MTTDLVVYDPAGEASYAPEVAAAAAALHPLFGLAGLFSKLMASRAQAKKFEAHARLIEREIKRDRFEHRERMTHAKQSADAVRRQSEQAFVVELERVAAIERAEGRAYELAVRRLETSFDAAIFDIESRGAAARRAIERELTTRLRAIDASLTLGLEQVRLQRHRDEETFRLLNREQDRRDRESRELLRQLNSAGRLATSRSRVTATIGAELVLGLSNAIALKTQHPSLSPVEFLLSSRPGV